MQKYLTRDEIYSLMYQIGGKDNWDAIYEVPSWLSLYDKMPRRMQMAFNLKIQGYTVKDISGLMDITEQVAYEHLRKAKKRVINSLLNYA